MTEEERLQLALEYYKKLSEGINPVNGEKIPSEDIASNRVLVGLFSYTARMLEELALIKKGAPKRKERINKGEKKRAFEISSEDQQKLRIFPYNVSISEIANQINEISKAEDMCTLKAEDISEWLINEGFLGVMVTEKKATAKRPTPRGKRLGITTELVIGKAENSKPYERVGLNSNAQKFIYTYLQDIIKYTFSDGRESRWYGDASIIVELYEKGLSVSEIAEETKHVPRSIRRQLTRRGIFPDQLPEDYVASKEYMN